MSTASEKNYEERKPLLQAYVLQRRILLGCVGLVFVALVFWIIAISTDHWYKVTTQQGIYITEHRRYFKYSHTGIWKTCRYSSIPTPLPDGRAVRGLPIVKNAAEPKMKLLNEPIVKGFLNITLPPANETKEIDDNYKKKLFALFVTSDKSFESYRLMYFNMTNLTVPVHNGSLDPIDPLDLEAAKMRLQTALVPLKINDTMFHYIIPIYLQNVLFSTWKESANVLIDILSSYAKELGMTARVIQNGKLLYLKPPPPPRRGSKGDGFFYTNLIQCKNIEIIPSAQDTTPVTEAMDEILDYQRTSASFACIAILVMVMAIMFSVYTFLNPRYTFKRLAAGIHIISAACCLVVIQVIAASVELLKQVPYYHPQGAENTYGYGIYIGWLVFAANLIAGFLFFYYSGKKKGNKAPTEELAMADEPTIMGR